MTFVRPSAIAPSPIKEDRLTATGKGRRLGRPTLDEAVALRDRFLNDAFTMLSERGVHGFSIDALAKASGVTKRTIYRQYESKAVLIEAVVEREARHLIDASDLLNAADAPLDCLRQWGWRLFEHLSREDTQRLGLFLRVAGLTESWAAEMLGNWGRRLLDAGGELVVAAQRNGDLREGDPELLVSLLLDLVDGVFNRIRYNVGAPVTASDSGFAQQYDRRWLAFLHLARKDWWI
jgi:AcrR family transcriptional regulator